MTILELYYYNIMNIILSCIIIYIYYHYNISKNKIKDYDINLSNFKNKYYDILDKIDIKNFLINNLEKDINKLTISNTNVQDELKKYIKVISTFKKIIILEELNDDDRNSHLRYLKSILKTCCIPYPEREYSDIVNYERDYDESIISIYMVSNQNFNNIKNKDEYLLKYRKIYDRKNYNSFIEKLKELTKNNKQYYYNTRKYYVNLHNELYDIDFSNLENVNINEYI